MKCFLRPFVLGLLLMGLLSGPAWAQTKIGTINLPKVFDNYWKRKDAETALKDRETDIQKELQSMMSDFDKGKEEYQKLLTGANDQAVSSDERRKRVRDNLLNDITTVLTAKAKAGNYSMIIDTEAQMPLGTKIVLFNNNENDLTDEVLKQLNAGAPAETPKAEEKKDDKKDDKKKSTKK